MGLVQYNIYVWWTHCRWIFRLRYDRTDYVTSKIQNDRTRSIHYHNIMYTEYWSFGLIKYLAIAEKLRFASEKKRGGGIWNTRADCRPSAVQSCAFFDDSSSISVVDTLWGVSDHRENVGNAKFAILRIVLCTPRVCASYLRVAVYVDDKYEYDMAVRSTHYTVGSRRVFPGRDASDTRRTRAPHKTRVRARARFDATTRLKTYRKKKQRRSCVYAYVINKK